MNYLGISVSKDLACGVVYNGIQPVAYRAFTYADGRAFPGCPYFHQWIAEKQIITHDKELDFSRAVRDLVMDFEVGVIGFDPKEIQSAGPLGVAIAADDPRVADALEELRCTAYHYPEGLFPANSPFHFMWGSVEIGSGRTDGILALCRAMLLEKANRQAWERMVRGG